MSGWNNEARSPSPEPSRAEFCHLWCDAWRQIECSEPRPGREPEWKRFDVANPPDVVLYAMRLAWRAARGADSTEIDAADLHRRAAAWLFATYRGRHTGENEDSLAALLLDVENEGVAIGLRLRSGVGPRVENPEAAPVEITPDPTNFATVRTVARPILLSESAAGREALGLLSDLDALTTRVRAFLDREVVR